LETGEQSQVSRVITVWRTLHLEIDSMGPPPTKATDPSWDERNFITGEVKRLQGYGDNVIRMILTPDPTPGMDRLRDASLHLDSKPTPGNGRFEWGSISLNKQLSEPPDTYFVDSNGIERVEPFGLNQSFRMPFKILDDGGNDICGGTLQESSPPGGDYTVHPDPVRDCWTKAQAEGETFSIESPMGWATPVRLPIAPGGVGPLTPSPGNAMLARVLVGGDGHLPFRLVDDDRATWPYEVNTQLLDEVDNPEVNAFAAAYIRPHRLAKGDPPGYAEGKAAAFMRNIECDKTGPDTCRSPEMDEAVRQGREVPSSPEYWVAYLQGAFQGPENEDRDPLSERGTMGLGDMHGASALIFREVLRDAAGATDVCSPQVTAHEIGHMFGLPDTKRVGGVMDSCGRPGDTYFRLEHLRDIRKGVIQ
jgi:hypothetical protein